MDLIFIFIGAFIVAISGALMPGPLLTITITHSLKKGFMAGPMVVLGHAILEVILLVIIIFGLYKFILINSVIKIIFIAAGVLLVLMGANFIVNINRMKFSPSHDDGGTEPSKLSRITDSPVLSGILVSFSNPYWLIWWLTIGLGLVLKAINYKFLGILSFFSGHILADLAWYSFVSFIFSKGKKYIDEKIYRTIIIICGVFLIIFGGWFLKSGIK